MLDAKAVLLQSNARKNCECNRLLYQLVKLKRKSKCMRENRITHALQIDSSSAFSIKRHTPAVSHFCIYTFHSASKTAIVRHAPGRSWNYLTSGQINEYKSTCTDTGCAPLFLIGLSSFTGVGMVG
jgi:hypothetical protein